MRFIKKSLFVALITSLFATISFGTDMTTPKEEAQLLVDELLPFAEKMLSEHGEFFPFGAHITADGKIEFDAASDGSEHPLSNTIIQLLHDAMAQGAKTGKIRCSGIAYDARVIPPGSSEKSDAVIIELEHKESYNVKVAFPYKLTGKSAQFSQPFAMPGNHLVFP